MIGKLLSCEELDAYNNHLGGDHSWLMFLETRAYGIFECDEAHIYIRQEDWLNQKYAYAYMTYTN
jgi:hypothetical protein